MEGVVDVATNLPLELLTQGLGVAAERVPAAVVEQGTRAVATAIRQQDSVGVGVDGSGHADLPLLLT